MRNNFIKTSITGNSNDLKSVLFSGQTSTPHNKQGKHLDWTKLRITFSEADLPILSKIALITLCQFLFFGHFSLLDINCNYYLSETYFPLFPSHCSINNKMMMMMTNTCLSVKYFY